MTQEQEELVSQLVFEAATRVHESLDAGEVLGFAVESLARLVPADAWAVFLKAEQSDRLELVRVTNAAGLTLEPFVDLGIRTTPLAQAVSGGRPLVQAVSPQGNSGTDGSVLSIPLLAGTRLIGAAQAIRKKPSPNFTAKEVAAGDVVCRSLARALANASEYHDATRQNLVDDLTRLYNVRFLYETLDNEIRRARRYGSPVSVVFMDLDGFKLVNDAHGHRAGSLTLTEVAQVITASVRDSDFVARFGGDEFVIMLPETSAARATQMAERVRRRIASHRFDGGVGGDIRLTASFGVASFPEHANEPERLIELADAAMYQAKMGSKNSVRVAAE
jgi:diguanylate cyclase (GGDEF)-like protein